MNNTPPSQAEKKKEAVHCFLCSKDITDLDKVATLWNFPYQYWDKSKGDWNKSLPKILNGVLCAECADQDFQLMRDRIEVKKTKIKDLKAQIKKLKRINP